MDSNQIPTYADLKREFPSLAESIEFPDNEYVYSSRIPQGLAWIDSLRIGPRLVKFGELSTDYVPIRFRISLDNSNIDTITHFKRTSIILGVNFPGPYVSDNHYWDKPINFLNSSKSPKVDEWNPGYCEKGGYLEIFRCAMSIHDRIEDSKTYIYSGKMTLKSNILSDEIGMTLDYTEYGDFYDTHVGYLAPTYELDHPIEKIEITTEKVIDLKFTYQSFSALPKNRGE